MDTDFARTFLSIVREGSFVAAAKRLHVTQTAITARIHNLEQQLGCQLFVRSRAGAKVTADGERFIPYATRLVETWEGACLDLAHMEGYEEVLTLGGEMSVCNPLMLKWATRLKTELQTHAIRVEVADGLALQEKLGHGLVSAALVYRPEYWPNIQVEHLMDEKLIQVSSVACSEPYVWVDWGAEYRAQHDIAMPGKSETALSFNLGPLALQYLLQSGGTGYFRARVVESYLNAGVLRRVPDAPEFSYPIYLVYSRENPSAALKKAFELLREIVKEEPDWSQKWSISV